jgi:dephospho-CoA kinase
MIFALSGPICSGKETVASYLKEKFNFIPVDLRKIAREQEGFEGSDIDLEI